tara:strand:- start:199 stop:597 length:399 start_codon:yes stop_codon:yes gene_type:complete
MMAKKAARKTQPQPVQQEQQPVAVAEPEPQEPEKWTMPKVCMGQIVVFYPRSTISVRNATIAHVMRVHERSIEVAFRGQGYSEVLHKDDDRFITNPDLRMDVDGVWDFTLERSSLDTRLDDIESRIKELEGK